MESAAKMPLKTMEPSGKTVEIKNTDHVKIYRCHPADENLEAEYDSDFEKSDKEQKASKKTVKEEGNKK